LQILDLDLKNPCRHVAMWRDGTNDVIVFASLELSKHFVM